MTTLKSDKITTTQNWTCPANVSLAWVTLVGAGGGGGGNTTGVALYNDVVDDDFGDSSLNAAWTTGYQTDGGAVEGAGNVVITAGQGVCSNAAFQPSGFYQAVDAGDFDISFIIIGTTLTNITTAGVGVSLGYWASANIYGSMRAANVASSNFSMYNWYGNNNGAMQSGGSTGNIAITGLILRAIRITNAITFLIKSTAGAEWTSLGSWTGAGAAAGRIWISVNKAAGSAFTATIDWFGDYPRICGQGGGGGGGETIYKFPVPVVANDNYIVTIGTGGAGGTGTNGAGAAGGNTYFANNANTVLLTAAGGSGGNADEPLNSVTAGGNGGGVQGGGPGGSSNIYLPYGGSGAGGGNNAAVGGKAGGFNGGANAGGTDAGGGGGASLFGPGGGGGNNISGATANGNTPSNYGGGGGGGGWNGQGGNGANGLAIIEYFG